MKMIFVLQVVWATISYDSNTFTKFAYQYSGGSRCNPPAQKQETVYFSDVFARPPKILINTILMDTNHPFVNYTFSITTVTTQSFTFNLECFLGTIFGPVYGIVLKWLAIDDERIQIINEFNMYSFENKTYPLVNSNAETVFISLINFSYQGPVYFDILASELTKTSVSVTITDPNNTLSNLLFLGYQVILGVKEAITIIDVIKTTAIYTSPKYVTQENSWLITPFVGFYYNVNDNVRLNFTQYQDQQKIWYTIESIYGIVTKFRIYFLDPQLFHLFRLTTKNWFNFIKNFPFSFSEKFYFQIIKKISEQISNIQIPLTIMFLTLVLQQQKGILLIELIIQ